jgi:predicted DNA-binding transcriptional regulator AlpA
MPNAAIRLHDIMGDHEPSSLPSSGETLEDIPEFEAGGHLHTFQDSTPGMRTVAKPEIARRPAGLNRAGDRETLENRSIPQTPGHDRLLNARQVAEKLGVSERWVRDHTSRRSPRIRAVKLGTLIRYRWADIEVFMESLDTFRTSRHPRFGV